MPEVHSDPADHRPSHVHILGFRNRDQDAHTQSVLRSIKKLQDCHSSNIYHQYNILHRFVYHGVDTTDWQWHLSGDTEEDPAVQRSVLPSIRHTDGSNLIRPLQHQDLRLLRR